MGKLLVTFDIFVHQNDLPPGRGTSWQKHPNSQIASIIPKSFLTWELALAGRCFLPSVQPDQMRMTPPNLQG